MNNAAYQAAVQITAALATHSNLMLTDEENAKLLANFFNTLYNELNNNYPPVEVK